MSAIIPNNSIVLDDPLNDAQKEQMFTFVSNFFWDGAKQLFPGIQKIAKTYIPLTQIFSDRAVIHRLTPLRETVLDPSLKAREFGLDLTKKGQLVAARVFMKTVIKGAAHDLDTAKLAYSNKLCFTRGVEGERRTIRPKMKLLLLDDPVQRLDRARVRAGLISPIEVILANTHFEDVAHCSREVRRREIRDMIIELSRSQDTVHIIQALGLLMQKEKGAIFISGNTDCTLGNLGKGYTSAAQARGLYNSRHSLFLNIKDDDNKKGIFIHETLHYLFNLLIREAVSPVKQNSLEERLLDEALRKDREHRQNRLPMTKGHCAVMDSIKMNLEKNLIYFPGGFNPQNKEHAHVMRAESIVRIMECLANGIPHQEVIDVAPNLYKFYFNYSKLLLEDFIRRSAPRPVCYKATVLTMGPSSMPTVLKKNPN